MRTNYKLGFGGRNAGRLATLVFALTVLLFAAPCARAEDDDAKAILKAMSDYVASLTTISLTFDTDIEVITPELEKIQFTNSGRLSLSRPDKLVASRTADTLMSNLSSTEKRSVHSARTSMPTRSSMHLERSIS